ncbi:Hypothetical protein POVR2_LOCUS58 [uncultured virus]|nr:Hypothetical protein POVR2_LOCUS58 [uncultured virus]
MNLIDLYSKLDDESLTFLKNQPSTSSGAVAVLATREFWHRRTEFALRSTIRERADVDWATIYYAIRDNSLLKVSGNVSIFDKIYEPGMKDVSVMDVMIEVGKPVATALTSHNIGKIASADVLKLLVSKNLLVYSDQDLEWSWGNAQSKAIVDELFYMLSDAGLISSKLDYYVHSAMIYCSIRGLSVLLDRVRHLDASKLNETRLDLWLTYALKLNKSDILNTLLVKYNYSSALLSTIVLREMSNYFSRPEIKQELFIDLVSDIEDEWLDEILLKAISASKLEVAKSMLQEHPRLQDILTWDLLIEHFRHAHSFSRKDFEFLTTYIDPTDQDNTLLIEALKYSDEQSVSMVLAYPSIDPTNNLDQVLLAAHGHYRGSYDYSTFYGVPEARLEISRAVSLTYSIPFDILGVNYPQEGLVTNIKLLVASPKFRIERLNVKQIRFISFVLKDSLTDCITGAIYAADLISPGTTVSYLGKLMEETSIYSIVLTFIVLKRPSASDLLTWLIELQDRRLALAARYALDGIDTGNADLLSIGRLLESCLHPSAKPLMLTRRDACLIGAYLGVERITYLQVSA